VNVYGALAARACFQAEKQLEMQLFRLFHNEREIDELNGELAHKNQTLDKENRRQQKIEDELKDRKKEHGKLMKDITKLEQQLKDSVRDTSSLSLSRGPCF